MEIHGCFYKIHFFLAFSDDIGVWKCKPFELQKVKTEQDLSLTITMALFENALSRYCIKFYITFVR